MARIHSRALYNWVATQFHANPALRPRDYHAVRTQWGRHERTHVDFDERRRANLPGYSRRTAAAIARRRRRGNQNRGHGPTGAAPVAAPNTGNGQPVSGMAGNGNSQAVQNPVHQAQPTHSAGCEDDENDEDDAPGDLDDDVNDFSKAAEGENNQEDEDVEGSEQLSVSPAAVETPTEQPGLSSLAQEVEEFRASQRVGDHIGDRVEDPAEQSRLSELPSFIGLDEESLEDDNAVDSTEQSAMPSTFPFLGELNEERNLEYDSFFDPSPGFELRQATYGIPQNTTPQDATNGYNYGATEGYTDPNLADGFFNDAGYGNIGNDNFGGPVHQAMNGPDYGTTQGNGLFNDTGYDSMGNVNVDGTQYNNFMAGESMGYASTSHTGMGYYDQTQNNPGIQNGLGHDYEIQNGMGHDYLTQNGIGHGNQSLNSNSYTAAANAGMAQEETDMNASRLHQSGPLMTPPETSPEDEAFPVNLAPLNRPANPPRAQYSYVTTSTGAKKVIKKVASGTPSVGLQSASGSPPAPLNAPANPPRANCSHQSTPATPARPPSETSQRQIVDSFLNQMNNGDELSFNVNSPALTQPAAPPTPTGLAGEMLHMVPPPTPTSPIHGSSLGHRKRNDDDEDADNEDGRKAKRAKKDNDQSKAPAQANGTTLGRCRRRRRRDDDDDHVEEEDGHKMKRRMVEKDDNQAQEPAATSPTPAQAPVPEPEPDVAPAPAIALPFPEFTSIEPLDWAPTWTSGFGPIEPSVLEGTMFNDGFNFDASFFPGFETFQNYAQNGENENAGQELDGVNPLNEDHGQGAAEPTVTNTLGATEDTDHVETGMEQPLHNNLEQFPTVVPDSPVLQAEADNNFPGQLHVMLPAAAQEDSFDLLAFVGGAQPDVQEGAGTGAFDSGAPLLDNFDFDPTSFDLDAFMREENWLQDEVAQPNELESQGEKLNLAASVN
ncbi:hypothetical protein BDY21DRAFT_360636 [Lineolata rhizophorae]|uniref:Uncharacterized protein n=1 Tax=Lineolata rhizophorae TaxID=578093 RepID=A0A6A6PDP3_9PEZI|nr:hypothetical protein BDY21DRAFT_360636 [Lineolata rhizophorae]